MAYRNPQCLNDGSPCAPDGEGGCVACDRVFTRVAVRAVGLGHPEQPPELVRDWACDPDDE